MLRLRSLYQRYGWVVVQLSIREVALRYRGSLFGIVWSLISPLLMLGLYAFVFTVVLRARWPGIEGVGGAWPYVVMLFSGLVLHSFLAECLTRAPQQIVGNANFVKKVVFPLPVIAIAQLGAAVFHLGINLLVLFAFQFAVFGYLPATVVLAPLVVLPLILIGLGAMWALSALTVYFRDLGQVVGVVVTLLLFLSPALYPLEQVPDAFAKFLQFNPLTPAIEYLRDVAIRGKIPHPVDWGGFALASCIAGVGGWFAFRRLQRGFADVL